MMKKKNLLLLVLLLAIGLSPALSQTKTVKKGGMQLSFPETYKVQDMDGGIAKGIIASDDLSGRVYLLLEMGQLSSPEYLMQYAIKNVEFVASATFIIDGEKTTFNSYDAVMSTFTTKIDGISYKGKAYTFNDGKKNSYGIVALYKGMILPNKDGILSTFKLVEAEEPQKSFKNAREEIQYLIESLGEAWGTSIGNGMLLDGMELHPTRNELTYTMRFAAIAISDIGDSNLAIARTEVESNMPEVLKTYAANMPAIKRCMDEDYTFVFRILDKNKQLMFTCTCTPQRYK